VLFSIRPLSPPAPRPSFTARVGPMSLLSATKLIEHQPKSCPSRSMPATNSRPLRPLRRSSSSMQRLTMHQLGPRAIQLRNR